MKPNIKSTRGEEDRNAYKHGFTRRSTRWAKRAVMNIKPAEFACHKACITRDCIWRTVIKTGHNSCRYLQSLTSKLCVNTCHRINVR